MGSRADGQICPSALDRRGFRNSRALFIRASAPGKRRTLPNQDMPASLQVFATGEILRLRRPVPPPLRMTRPRRPVPPPLRMTRGSGRCAPCAQDDKGSRADGQICPSALDRRDFRRAHPRVRSGPEGAMAPSARRCVPAVRRAPPPRICRRRCRRLRPGRSFDFGRCAPCAQDDEMPGAFSPAPPYPSAASTSAARLALTALSPPRM